jgi:hydrogenase maturation protease
MLLGDDGVGLALLERLKALHPWGACVELLDGGTQALALLGQLEDRRAVLILDAVALGAPPGTVHVLEGEALLGTGRRAGTAHEGNAGELLRAALLLGQLPVYVCAVGVEPERVGTGIGLSGAVSAALDGALECARSRLEAMLGELG